MNLLTVTNCDELGGDIGPFGKQAMLVIRNPVCNNLVHYIIIIIIYSVVLEPSLPELNPWYCQVRLAPILYNPYLSILNANNNNTPTPSAAISPHGPNAVVSFPVLIIMIITWTVLHHFNGII